MAICVIKLFFFFSYQLLKVNNIVVVNFYAKQLLANNPSQSHLLLWKPLMKDKTILLIRFHQKYFDPTKEPHGNISNWITKRMSEKSVSDKFLFVRMSFSQDFS